MLSCAHSNWGQPHCFAFMMWLNCAVTCPTPAREEGFKISLMWSHYLQQGFTGTLSRSKAELKRHCCWVQGLSTQHLTVYTSHSQKMCVCEYERCVLNGAFQPLPKMPQSICHHEYEPSQDQLLAPWRVLGDLNLICDQSVVWVVFVCVMETDGRCVSTSGSAGKLMVSNDGWESEPMIAFMGWILMRLLGQQGIFRPFFGPCFNTNITQRSQSPQSSNTIWISFTSSSHQVLLIFVYKSRGRRETALSWYAFSQYSTGFSCIWYSLF